MEIKNQDLDSQNNLCTILSKKNEVLTKENTILNILKKDLTEEKENLLADLDSLKNENNSLKQMIKETESNTSAPVANNVNKIL